MDEVVEALEKYQGLVPLVYDDVETMGLVEARPEDMPYAVYLKQDADKVIAHHKYKRCLAMAKVCYLRFVRYENFLQKLCASNATIAAYKFRRDMYDKWEKRWLEYAKKFKSNSK